MLTGHFLAATGRPHTKAKREPPSTPSAIRKLGFALLGVLGACSSEEPKGQVVASVNGVEITEGALQAEARARRISISGEEDQAARAEVLQHVIDRTLLAQHAREQRLHETPQFLADLKRNEETMIAGLATAKVIRDPGRPTPAELRKTIDNNPELFNNREWLTVDQITFKTPAGGPDFLKNINTMSDVERFLKNSKIPFERKQARIDSANVPRELVSRLRQLPTGELYYYPRGPVAVVGLVLDRSPFLMPEAEQMELASRILRRKKVNDQIGAAIKRLREGAEIRYKAGMKPELEKTK